MARKFLYLVAIIIVLVIASGVAYVLFPVQTMSLALVPGDEFKAQAAKPPSVYADAALWLARPDIADNPSDWLPPGIEAGASGAAAVFYIHPTSYINRAAWNAPLDDERANELATLWVKGQASVFSAAGEIWAPRYRQATFGAFLTTGEARERALDLAYGDVSAAFDHFVASIDAKRPIILAGHSQGALHLTRLLKDKIAGKPVAKRIVAAYAVGWPISVTADLPALGLPACDTPEAANCVLSWQSFAEPADPSPIVAAYDTTTGYTGQPRASTPMLCTNPITGIPNTEAPADANLGTTKPSGDLKSAELIKGGVPARCDERGFLLIGAPPEMAGYVLMGNNYHVYDFSLFWVNVREDAVRRLATFAAP